MRAICAVLSANRLLADHVVGAAKDTLAREDRGGEAVSRIFQILTSEGLRKGALEHIVRALCVAARCRYLDLVVIRGTLVLRKELCDRCVVAGALLATLGRQGRWGLLEHRVRGHGLTLEILGDDSLRAATNGRLLLGQSLDELGSTQEIDDFWLKHVA